MEVVVQPRCMNGITIACLAVIAFLYLAVTFNVIVPHLGYSVHGATHLMIFTALTGLAAATYLQCVYCDPGKVPLGWQPDTEQQSAAAVLQVKRRGGGRRFCKKCQSFKPPRTHHCRRCGHCVLRMDHHCVWVNNCIGHGNYRAFLLMCCYLTAACLHALALLLQMDAHLVQIALGWDEDSRLLAAAGARTKELPGSDSEAAAAAAAGGARAVGLAADVGAAAPSSSSVIRSSKTGWEGAFWMRVVVQILATTAALPISTGLVVLLVWNGILCLRNQTTIEYHEGVVAQYMAAATSVTSRTGASSNIGSTSGSSSSSSRACSSSHPFDLGWHDNLHSACGDSAACWLLPGRAAARGDGLTFPTCWDQHPTWQQQAQSR